jgi:hypothetical protein
LERDAQLSPGAAGPPADFGGRRKRRTRPRAQACVAEILGDAEKRSPLAFTLFDVTEFSTHFGRVPFFPNARASVSGLIQRRRRLTPASPKDLNYQYNRIELQILLTGRFNAP